MEKVRACECSKCEKNNKNQLGFNIGDSIKVYSYGHQLCKIGMFLEKNHSFLKWLDQEQHIHFTSLQSIHIQKLN
ncbi:hypothetical protein ACP3VS_18455 [Lysinibacillus sp. VIII_CA]|uniref:hypothetical protein n=1 Tax=Lysinibacillus sp. VIII_CA TaxID=3417452 RepID=UPI003CF6437D